MAWARRAAARGWCAPSATQVAIECFWLCLVIAQGLQGPKYIRRQPSVAAAEEIATVFQTNSCGNFLRPFLTNSVSNKQLWELPETLPHKQCFKQTVGGTS